MYASKFSCLIVIVVFCVVGNNALPNENHKMKVHAKLLSTGLECMSDHPLQIEHISMLRSRKVPDDENAKCFMACVNKKIGVFDDSGKIDEKGAKKFTKRIFKVGDDSVTKVDELFDTCIHVNDVETSDGDKGCERAKLAFECFVEHGPKLGFDFEF